MGMQHHVLLPVIFFGIATSSLVLSRSLHPQEMPDQAYFRKWLEQDVVYIIAQEERETFLKLTTAEEKESFIEQFWLRRDPDPRTPGNEFKEEHYRRITYANEHFHTGIDGWRTDRGMIYIKFGPPTGIEKHPEGGSYIRKSYEGGGMTSTYPFEVWFYNQIEGVGSGVELEFVDASKTNEYRLARDAEEKDALLHVPGAGLTLAESLGLQSRYDRLRVRGIGNPDSGNIHDIDPGLQPLRIQDYPMQRLETLYKLQRAPSPKYRDLAAAVSVRVTYDQLPVRYQADILQISNEVSLVPITLFFARSDLGFKAGETPGVSMAPLSIFGQVQTIQGRLAFAFEDSLQVSLRDSEREKELRQLALFQKRLPLRAGRYKLSLVVKDENSGKMTTLDRLLLIPGGSIDGLATSSVILTPQVIPAARNASLDEPFILGKYKVIPAPGNEFVPEDRFVQAYFEVYNLDLDQATLQPSPQLAISLLKDGRQVFPLTRFANEYEFVGDRLLVHKTLPFDGLEAGEYTVIFRVTDLLTRRSIEPRVSFVLKEK